MSNAKGQRMSRSSLLALIAFFWFGWGTEYLPPAHAAASRTPDEPPFAVDKSTLGTKRRVKTGIKKIDAPSRRLAGTRWEIQSSLDPGKPQADCFYSRGQKKFCRDGAFAGAFESADGRRVLTYSAGSTIDSPQEKFVAVYDAESGEKIREAPIPGGGNMTGVSAPGRDLFVAFYHDVGGKIVLQAFDFSGNVKWRRVFEARVTPSNGPDSIAISGDGKHIFLATIPIPLEADRGTVIVLSESGEIKRELAVGAQRIILNPAKTLVAFWNRKGYRLYSIADDRILLQESCGSGPYSWCLTKGFSPDGRFLAVIGLEEDHRKEKKSRVVRVDAVDVMKRRVHRDTLNEEIGSDLRVEFGSDDSLSVLSAEKTISYETIP